MGGSSSKFKCGGMVVQTDQSFYYSGDQVTGSIYVQIDQAFPAKKLTLTIKGKEKCEWREKKTRRDKDGHIEEYYEDHHNSNDIFKYEQDVYLFSGGLIPAGQYVFPFAFLLPQVCPSSIYFSGDDNAEATIKYSCSAKFKAKDHTPVADIKYKCPLVIREMPKAGSTNIEAKSKVKINKCCCCGSLGECELKALFEKNCYTSQEVAQAVIEVDNSNCKAPVDKVSMQLKQHITLKTGSSIYRRTYAV